MKANLGIALSGGGVRGVAHIGVLKALEEHDIHPEIVSGTSAGAMVGTLYAYGMSPAAILDVFKSSSLRKLFRVSMPTIGLTDNSYIREMLQELIPEDDFSALKKPMYVSVTNMSTGQNEIISEGPLYDIVTASASIPVLFKSKKIGPHIYVDGGVLNNLPVEPLIDQCQRIIGVNVTPVDGEDHLGNLLEIGMRTFELALWANVEYRLRQCDVRIEPPADRYSLFDLEKAQEIHDIGYETALKHIDEVRREEKKDSPNLATQIQNWWNDLTN